MFIEVVLVWKSGVAGVYRLSVHPLWWVERILEHMHKHVDSSA
jgi:hypothetical protein